MDGRHIYSPGTVADIIDFARVRGVRVIPEFDMPGHSTSWFVGYPGLRTDCPAGSVKEFSKPMDPSKNYTYSFLQKFLKEMSGRFQDEFFHIGGDEVDGTCWQSTSSVQQFCKDHNLTSSPALQMYFEEKVVSMLTNLGKTPVIWEENFGSTTGYPEGAIVEVWKHKWGNTTILDTLIKEGYKTIYTTTDWYLDYSTNAINGGFTRRIDDISEWEYYYRVEPFTNSSLDEKEQEKLLGAEVCSWNPYFDGTNLLSNVFPRSVAVGERLWSDKSVRNLTSALSRIQNQRCRMVARGIPVSPVNFADHCPYPYEFTYVSP
jgi:hexosaminidase